MTVSDAAMSGPEATPPQTPGLSKGTSDSSLITAKECLRQFPRRLKEFFRVNHDVTSLLLLGFSGPPASLLARGAVTPGAPGPMDSGFLPFLAFPGGLICEIPTPPYAPPADTWLGPPSAAQRPWRSKEASSQDGEGGQGHGSPGTAHLGSFPPFPPRHSVTHQTGLLHLRLLSWTLL